MKFDEFEKAMLLSDERMAIDRDIDLGLHRILKTLKTEQGVIHA